MQTQLLLNVVPNLVMCGVLEILQRGRQKSAAGQRSHPFCHRSEVFSLTWFPPSPWHGYMISFFPPSLFSPASRHESLPTFFTYRGGSGRGRSSERKQNEKLTRSASCSNNASPRSAFGSVRLELYNSLWRSKWKPTVARRSAEVWKGDSCWWGCVILLNQSWVGWDREWRLLGKCSSNTMRSSCTSVARAGPCAQRCLQMPSVESRSRETQVNNNLSKCAEDFLKYSPSPTQC